MKILLMAYECSPYRGSEWAVGWGRLLGAAKVADVSVVTSEENLLALQQARTQGLVPANVHVHAPASDRKLRRLASKPVHFAYNYRAYRYWQTLAFELAEQLHASEPFDLVHQVNVCTFREPGEGWRLGIPFLWGPVGGSQNLPTRFLGSLPPKQALKEGLRTVSNGFALSKGRVQSAARYAALIYAANSTNQSDFMNAFGREVGLLLETGLHEVNEPDRSRFEERVAAARKGQPPSPLRLLWSGTLETRKALPILLRALACLEPSLSWTLDVIGDGPLRKLWEGEAHRHKLLDRVTFTGRLPFEQAVEAMGQADVFCFTSLRDTSGNVVLEALAAGVPVICFDHQGAGDIVTYRCGRKLPVLSPQQAYRDWASAITHFARNPEDHLRLSKGATERARDFLWAKNHEQINAVYERLARSTTQSNTELAPLQTSVVRTLTESAVGGTR